MTPGSDIVVTISRDFPSVGSLVMAQVARESKTRMCAFQYPDSRSGDPDDFAPCAESWAVGSRTKTLRTGSL